MPELSPFSRALAVIAFVGQDLSVSETRHEAKLLLVGAPRILTSVLEPERIEPVEANRATMRESATLIWLSRLQWLLLATEAVAKRTREVVGALPADAACSVHDVGARFAGLKIQGARAAQVLNAGCSLDLRDRRFGVGCTAQTRIEQVPVILLRSAPAQFEMMVERPLAHYLWRWIQEVIR